MENRKQVATVSERLSEAMADAGKKQIDLVRETGLDKASISSYLSGKYEPKSKSIGLLSRALGVSEMWLWGYDVPKGRTPEQKKNDRLSEMVTKLRVDSDFFEMVAKLGADSDLFGMVTKLGADPDLFEVVSMFVQLPPEEYASIRQLVSAIIKK